MKSFAAGSELTCSHAVPYMIAVQRKRRLHRNAERGDRRMVLEPGGQSLITQYGSTVYIGIAMGGPAL